MTKAFKDVLASSKAALMAYKGVHPTARVFSIEDVRVLINRIEYLQARLDRPYQAESQLSPTTRCPDGELHKLRCIRCELPATGVSTSPSAEPLICESAAPLHDAFLRDMSHPPRTDCQIEGVHLCSPAATTTLCLCGHPYHDHDEETAECQAFGCDCGCCEAVTSAIQHGINCSKVPHETEGYLHAERDDAPYDVDGVIYCGRCHVALS